MVTWADLAAEATARYPHSHGLRNAFLAGARARMEGRPLSRCPYVVGGGRGGWRAVWRAAWVRGWRSA